MELDDPSSSDELKNFADQYVEPRLVVLWNLYRT